MFGVLDIQMKIVKDVYILDPALKYIKEETRSEKKR